MAKNEEYDCFIDWWSVGIIIYELMYQRKPFDQENTKPIGLDKKEWAKQKKEIYLENLNKEEFENIFENKDDKYSKDLQNLVM